MASTTLSVGNAIGLAVLVAIANAHTGGLVGEAQRTAIASGIQIALWLAAAGILICLVPAFVLPRKAPALMAE